MNTNAIETMFGRIGARVKVSDVAPSIPKGINISNDSRGEYFDIRLEPQESVESDDRAERLASRDDEHGSRSPWCDQGRFSRLTIINLQERFDSIPF